MGLARKKRSPIPLPAGGIPANCEIKRMISCGNPYTETEKGYFQVNLNSPSRFRCRHFSDISVSSLVCGGRGIRTPGSSHFNGFQDRRNRPLCHPSGDKDSAR